MSTAVQVTPTLAGRTSRTETIVEPGGELAEGVVLATPREVGAWPGAVSRNVVWVVLGEEPIPPHARPFLRLPQRAEAALVESAIDSAIEFVQLRRRVAHLQEETRRLQERQLELARVGIALSAEHDLERLLELILSTARELVSADAGSLYLVETAGGERRLRFVLAQNDSVPARLAGSTIALDSSSLAGHVAVHGEPVAVEDVRHLPEDVPYRPNTRVDLATGYHTRSLLTVPLETRGGEVIGVLQLINRKTEPSAVIANAEDADRFVRPFGRQDISVIRSLAGQAAVAIENSRLVQEIERLFESFVRASVTAIEQRDPSTSGHSLRVAHYVVALARAVEQAPPPTLTGLRFDRDALTQLRYAALLHDFGKVGVREAVLTKSKKLFPERLARIHERFAHAARAREVSLLRRYLETLQRQQRSPQASDLAALDAAVQEVRAELESYLAGVLAANEPAVLEEATAHLVSQAARATFPGVGGEPLPLLLAEEVRALSVPRGSLDEEERLEVESHVTHSYQFLLTIPWPSRYARVPEIAYGHHEKLDGRGYPNRLTAPHIPPEVRMLTVCDIYDALSAGDRPYKRAVSPTRALEILEQEARQGGVDPEVLRVFVEARIYAQPLPESLA
jgi:HD-GYP domain-containing protein (c-di-GMP phosphodiesterase class II)